MVFLDRQIFYPSVNPFFRSDFRCLVMFPPHSKAISRAMKRSEMKNGSSLWLVILGFQQATSAQNRRGEADIIGEGGAAEGGGNTQRGLPRAFPPNWIFCAEICFYNSVFSVLYIGRYFLSFNPFLALVFTAFIADFCELSIVASYRCVVALYRFIVASCRCYPQLR